jgi:hypothetical protein
MDFPVYKKLIKLLSRHGIDTVAYCAAHKLYVLEQPQKEPELLTNHHIYMLLRESGVTKFALETVHTTEEAGKYLAIDRVNAMLLCNALEATKTQSNSAVIHQMRRAAGQVCPLCGGPLELQNGEAGKIHRGPHEYRRVRCHYRTKKSFNCNFRVELDPQAAALFREYAYPTDAWLKKTDSICRNCNRESLYELTPQIGSPVHFCFGSDRTGGKNKYCFFEKLQTKK